MITMVEMESKTSVFILAFFLVVLDRTNGLSITVEHGTMGKTIDVIGKTSNLFNDRQPTLSAKNPRKQYSITMNKYLQQTVDTSFNSPQKKPHKFGKKVLPIVSKQKPHSYVQSNEYDVSTKRIKRSHHHHKNESDKVIIQNYGVISKLDDKSVQDKKVVELRLIKKDRKKKEEKKKGKEKKSKKKYKHKTTLPPTYYTSSKPDVKIENVTNIIQSTTTKPKSNEKHLSSSIEAFQTVELVPPKTFECGRVPIFNKKSVHLNSSLEKVGPATLVHNTDALGGEWPWIAQIHICQNGNSSSCITCTGTLLNENWLMTTGHCVSDFQNSSYNFSATFVAPRESLEGRLRNVSSKSNKIVQTVLHPDYEDMNNDLALLRLDEKVQLSEFIQPVCMLPPTHSLMQYSNERDCYMLGYGLKKGKENSRRLQSVKIRIESPSNCNTDVLHETTMKIGTVCISSIGKVANLACETDSGGPNLCYDQKLNQWQVFGVTSYTSTMCNSNSVHSLSTDLTNYRSWIMSTIGV